MAQKRTVKARSKPHRRTAKPRAKRKLKPARSVAWPFRLHAPMQTEPSNSLLQTQTGDVAIEVKAELRPAARGAPAGASPPIRPDDILEFEFAEGQRVWMRADDYRAQYGETTARDAADDVMTLPSNLQILPTAMQNRGVIAWVVKSVKVLGIDLPALTATQIAQKIETKPSKRRPGPGLFGCTLETDGFALGSIQLPPRELPGAKPWLVLIHGTASSTWGSFGDLWYPERQRELTALRDAYGDRVLAFEHQTLATSPLQNAVELAELLPAGARVHLVTHSRGGLVGELLCRASNAQGFESEEVAAFAKDERYSAPGPSGKSEAEWLRALGKALRSRPLVIERFVRVACPTLGTTLASGRLDRWLSVIGSVAGAALPGTPMAEAFSDFYDFVAAVIKERTDPKTLPGLEAMMPDSGVVRLANSPRTEVAGDLFVIAGDIDPDAWWARLLVWMTDRFYDGDHDLVVNTQSMYGGVRRAGEALVSYHKGPSVNHFTYFRNADSAERLVRALTHAPGDTADFEPLDQPVGTPETLKTLVARAAVTKPSPKPRPVVVVLPGIMGSELFDGNDRVWISVVALMFGGLERLKIGASKIAPWQPIERYYGALQTYLGDSHKVVAFGYDWRLPIEREAERLAKVVAAELKAADPAGMPVRLLAHSMGGLVARTMIANHRDLWKDMCKNPGARLLMLGTPNGGSHAVTELIVGQSSTLRGIATLDLKNSQSKLLKVVTRFPGLLDLLPKELQDDWFSADTWSKFHRLAGRDWVLPQKADLDIARKFRDAFDRAPVDPERMIYVAGNADVTVAGMYYDEKSHEICFQGTSRGDGRVPWETGIPPGVPTWYMDVEHGDLCAYPPAFPALQQLLETGRTMLLPQTPRVPRAASKLFPMPRAAETLYPTEEALLAAALGAGSRKRRTLARREPPVEVRVVHGNLYFVSHPVMVGHYEGDAILSAEKALDDALDGELSQRHMLGRYPGPINSGPALFVNPALGDDRFATPPGAIVLGLGIPGSLTTQRLADAVRGALLEYVLKWEKQAGVRAAKVTEEGFSKYSISMLLIGTAAGGVNVADSVYAMLIAVARANDVLAAAAQNKRILEVELIEVWEDRAIQAVKSFPTLNGDPRLRGRFNFATALRSAKGGRRRGTYSEPAGWWQRTQILGASDKGDASTQPLRFTTTTRRARSEVRLLATQRAVVDRFVADAIGTTRDDRRISRTLFELLLPNELKESAPDQDNLMLILDEASARYPWELLEDPRGSRAEPLAIRQGMLRTLESRDFRGTVEGTTDLSALVIGDPVSSLPALAGAQREAETVARALRAEGKLRVEKHIRPDAQEVIAALYLHPYRIVHLAGHGVYRFPRSQLPGVKPSKSGSNGSDTVTGMVIGDGEFLTPIEIRQMRRVPDLVFINCCHLGYIENVGASATAAGDAFGKYNLFAANVATEFIKIGVRAVVAAGWAVDDEAALTFATALYSHMLAGVTFGEAVKRARRETYDRHTATNTWGAYQCYGDPAFRLVRDSDETGETGEQLSFVSPAQAAMEIDDLAANLATAAGSTASWQLDRLNDIVKELTRLGWMDIGRLRAALGRAYGEALCLDEAVTHFRYALLNDPSPMSAKDVEQMANFMSRAAVESWLRAQAGGTAQQSGQQAIDEAIAVLKWLIKPPIRAAAATRSKVADAEPGATAERLALLGSAYKRKAWIGVEVEDSLTQMHHYYTRALVMSCENTERRDDPYPLLNQLFAQVVLDWFEIHPDGAAGLAHAAVEKQLSVITANLRLRLERSKEFWDVVMLADSELLAALVRSDLDKHVSRVAAQYREARKIASPREFASVLDQLEFLWAMAIRAEPDCAPAIRDLTEKVRGDVPKPAGGAARPKPQSPAKAAQSIAKKNKRKATSDRRRKTRPRVS